MQFCYITSFNIVIIAMMLAAHSSLFLLRIKYSDFDEVSKCKSEDRDVAEMIVVGIKIAFLTSCPLINTIIAVVLCVFWKDFRDAVYNKLEKTYTERRLSYYE